uniref:Transmembrane protein n=1 Tax=Gossypium raimondii TaxID=29730 RepID=A0A0D2RXQ2_GOSRA|nr:hypothetical protein B456_004G119800 [Gossypium raimondii]KJB23881.1 hypothetical protein B456_004G119800 [Gossypium raimondii]
MSLLPFFHIYMHLLLQTLLSLSLALILTFFKIPIFFLTGLHTYVHPEKAGSANNASSGLRAATRRPFSDSGSQLDGHHYLSSIPNEELKNRNKSKVKFDFDENNAHIFRLKLEEGHLQTRLLFNEYRNSFDFSFLGLSCLCLSKCLGESEPGSGVLINGNLIPVIFGFIGLTKAFLALAKISFENSASKRSEKQFSAIFGVLGFLVGIMICSGIGPPVFDFHFDSVFCICLPARMHGSFGLELISLALLWINPLAEILVNKNSYNGGVADKLVRNMFLNEAFLFWYQRLHASKVSDLDFSRAKILLHNHYLCLAVLQLFAPPVLVLVFLGLSQVDTNSFDKYNLVCGSLPCSAFIKEASLFMAWWIIFVWVVITSASLVFYRHATLYIF